MLCFIFIFTPGNSYEIEATHSLPSCFPQRGFAGPITSETRFVRPEICATWLACIARSETRADTLQKFRDERSLWNGRCCLPRITEISGYSKLGRGLPFRETKNTKFRTPHFPIGGQTNVALVSPLNLCVYSGRRFPRGVTEQDNVKVALSGWRHVRYYAC